MTPATPEIERDLLEATAVGHNAYVAFVQERLADKTVSFHSPLRKQKLRTFAALKTKVKLSSTQNKLVEVKAQRNLFGQLVMLSEENNVSMDKALTYQLGPVPWTLATADRCPMKTDKAKLMHNVETGTVVFEKPGLRDSVYDIYDGNALLQAMTGLPDTFEELAEKVFSLLPKTERVDFVTDTYKDVSIKGAERERRGVREQFLIKGPKTKVPRDWKAFMGNNENKKQLVKLLLTEWSKDKYAQKIKGRRIMFACEEECMCICSLDGVTVTSSAVEKLFTSQEEADTRIILHLEHAAREATCDKKLIFRSPDTDVYVLLLTFVQKLAHTVLFDTGTGNKRRLLDVKLAIQHEGAEKSKALMGLHCFTGCDTTSAFVRQGKIKPKKVLEKHPEFVPVFSGLGEQNHVDEDTSRQLETFVCHMYGKPKYTDVNSLRTDIFRQKYQPKSEEPLSSVDGIDLSLLPPCRSSLSMHVRRVNYQTLIWKAASMQYPDIPEPDGHGWKLTDSGHLDNNWTDSPILPPEMIDLLTQQSTGSDDEDESHADTDDDVEFDNYIDIIFEEETDEV